MYENNGLEEDSYRKREFYRIKLGKVRLKSDAQDPKAIYREWVDKDKVKHEAWERVYKGISGYLVDIKTHVAKFGEQYNIYIDQLTEDSPMRIISFSSGDEYLKDFLKKLPNIDLKKPLTIRPYEVERTDKPGKFNKGLTILQNPLDEKDKVLSYFYDKESKANLYGYPVMTEKSPDTEDWKIYFIQEMKFLKKWTFEKVIPELENISNSDLITDEDAMNFKNDAGQEPEKTTQQEVPDVTTEEEQDLPF